MIPEWPGLIEASEEKGWADGVEMREMEPMLPSRDAPEAYDAYVTAYWHGYVAGIKARVVRTSPEHWGL